MYIDVWVVNHKYGSEVFTRDGLLEYVQRWADDLSLFGGATQEDVDFVRHPDTHPDDAINRYFDLHPDEWADPYSLEVTSKDLRDYPVGRTTP